MHRRLQIATVTVILPAGQASAALQRLRVTGQDRDTVPGRLSMPDRPIPHRLQLRRREILVHGLELLQAGNVGLFPLQPIQQVGQPGPDAIDVEGRDPKVFHSARTRKAKSQLRPTNGLGGCNRFSGTRFRQGLAFLQQARKGLLVDRPAEEITLHFVALVRAQ